jgi:hypothetical protein
MHHRQATFKQEQLVKCENALRSRQPWLADSGDGLFSSDRSVARHVNADSERPARQRVGRHYFRQLVDDAGLTSLL